MTAFAPTPGCGTGCLPHPMPGGLTRSLVAAARLGAVAGTMLAALGLAAALPVLPARARAAAVRGWFRGLLRACGVRLVVRGAPDHTPVLVAANHVSWLDIPALLAVAPARVLAKSDVRAWPVVGSLATRAGTIFIDRYRVRTLPLTVAEIAAALREGQTVLVFPEGSTWCGRGDRQIVRERAHGGQFYPATLQAAVAAGVPVRPARLRYLLDGRPTTLAAFLGDDSLWASMRRILPARGLSVEVDLRPAVTAPDRRHLARAAASAVAGLRPAEAAVGCSPGRFTRAKRPGPRGAGPPLSM